MCWRNIDIDGVLIKGEPTCQIAEMGIQVYKIMKIKYGRLRSYFMDLPYKVSNEYSLEETGGKLIVNNDVNMYSYICIGFHAYTNKCHLMVNKHGNVEVRCGNFWIESYIANVDTQDLVLARCVIPKGSKYYVNGLGEAVSDRMIIKNYGSLRRFKDYNGGEIIKFDDVPMELLI